MLKIRRSEVVQNNKDRLDLFYLPGSKYDTVEELYDGTIKIHPYSKKYFNYLFQYRGSILHYNSVNGNVQSMEQPGSECYVINRNCSLKMTGYNGFVASDGHYYFLNSYDKCLDVFDSDFISVKRIRLNENADSFTLSGDKFIFYDRSRNLITVYSLQGEEFLKIKSAEVKGIGNKSFFADANELWIADSEENLIYNYDLNEIKLKYQILTPFFDPHSLTIFNNNIWVLYGGEVNETSYCQRCWAEQKPFFHKLKFKLTEKEGYNHTISNCFSTEFTYEENFLKNKSVNANNVRVQIALPHNNIRQKLSKYEILGCRGGEVKPGVIELDLGDVRSESGGYIGYKAFLELSSVKYTFFDDVEPTDIPDNHIVPNDEKLMTGHSVMRELAKLEKCGQIEGILELRNRVFDRLFYKTNNRARDYVELLRDGYGTCGDFSSIILALSVINNFPVRTCGGFKVPRFTNSIAENRSCYYNHTWLDVFIKGAGWVPFESSSDDREFNGRLSEGQFLGEDWSHIRTHSDKTVPNLINVSSEKGEIHPFDLFGNSSYMKITGEIPLKEDE